eukprot:s478_g9.t1
MKQESEGPAISEDSVGAFRPEAFKKKRNTKFTESSWTLAGPQLSYVVPVGVDVPFAHPTLLKIAPPQR